MTLFIACLLIYHFDMNWWWYLVAAAIWIGKWRALENAVQHNVDLIQNNITLIGDKMQKWRT